MAMIDVEGGFPQWNPLVRRFGTESPIFASGNMERELLAKHLAIDLTHQKHLNDDVVEDDDDDDDDDGSNYNANAERHTASCCVCSRAYPTSRLLSIHVSEAHDDGFFQAKVAQGYAMYECFVEGCGLKLKSCESRQQHLMDCHNFTTSSLDYFSDEANKAPDMEVENERSINGLFSAVSKLSTCSESNRRRRKKHMQQEKPVVTESDQRCSKCMRRY